jgi:hypothetical protein
MTNPKEPGPADPNQKAREKAEDDLDEALEETFPASDPISPMRPGQDD